MLLCSNCAVRGDCDKKVDGEHWKGCYIASKFKREREYGICTSCGARRYRTLAGGHTIQLIGYKDMDEKIREEKLEKIIRCKDCSDWFKEVAPEPTNRQLAIWEREKKMGEAFSTLEDGGYRLNQFRKYNFKDIESTIKNMEKALKVVKKLSKYSNTKLRGGA